MQSVQLRLNFNTALEQYRCVLGTDRVQVRYQLNESGRGWVQWGYSSGTVSILVTYSLCKLSMAQVQFRYSSGTVRRRVAPFVFVSVEKRH